MKNLFYLERQDIPSLVLIHGLGSNHKAWKFQIEYLSKRYRVVTGDTKWHGKSKSSSIPNKYSIKQFADDWWRLIDELKLNRPFLMGSGMGSVIALQIALGHPNKIGGLILINAYSNCDDDFRVWLEKWVKIVQKEGVESLTRFIIPHFFRESFIKEKPEVISFYSKVRSEQTAQTVILACKACMKFDVTERLKKIRIPVLLIAGEYDVLTPPFKSKFILERIPHAKYININESSHMAFLEKPSEFNRIVVDFVDKIFGTLFI